MTGRFTWSHVLYRLLATDGALLYVGITNSLERRFAKHAREQPWWSEVADARVEFHPDREALERAEHVAIETEVPRYNRVAGIDHDRPVYFGDYVAGRRVTLAARLEPSLLAELAQLPGAGERGGLSRVARELLGEALASRGHNVRV